MAAELQGRRPATLGEIGHRQLRAVLGRVIEAGWQEVCEPCEVTRARARRRAAVTADTAPLRHVLATSSSRGAR